MEAPQAFRVANKQQQVRLQAIIGYRPDSIIFFECINVDVPSAAKI
jgi:hypothetical protein